MPKSAFNHNGDETDNTGDGRSTAGSGKAKRKSKPTGKAENRRKKIKKRYSSAREEAQLEGIIPTTPDGAIHPERVDPAKQQTQPLPELTAAAIRHGWAVPEEKKPRLVDELTSILDDPEAPAKVKVAAFNALRAADQAQYERDHPEAANPKTGSTVIAGSINIQNNVQTAAVIREMITRGELGLVEELSAPDQSSASSVGGQLREVEITGTHTDNQQQASEGMVDTE